jgi:hypothetical protein
MAMRTDAVLAVWNDVLPPFEAEFNDWYVRDHFPDRLAIPGFRRGRRWLSTDAAPRYFTFYEIDDVGVMHSPAYLARHENPTDWTRKIMPAFVGMNRSTCRVTARLGNGDGGVAAVVRLAPSAGAAAALRTWVASDALPSIMRLPGIVGGCLWELDAAASRRPDTAETRLRATPDAVVDWVLVIEATRPEEAARVADVAGSAAAAGAVRVGPVETYRLLCSLSRDPAISDTAVA